MSSNPLVRSGKAILFLYEGETEGEFYDNIFQTKIENRNVKFKPKCMEGVYNLNKKVRNAIDTFLNDNNHQDITALYVIVAHDREGPKNQPGPFNLSLLKKDFKDEKRIKSIDQIIATQDLESWLFYEIDNIYKFLGTPNSQRNPEKYKNVESFNNRHLSQLFRQNKKIYQKGKRVEGFLKALDINNIFQKCLELNKCTALLNRICQVKKGKKGKK